MRKARARAEASSRRDNVLRSLSISITIFSIGGGGAGMLCTVIGWTHWLFHAFPRSVPDAWHVPAGFMSGIMCIFFASMGSLDGWPMHGCPGMPAAQEGRRQQPSLWQDMNGCAYRLTD